LRHRGQITQAVVYDPARNELFSASRGGGAFMNDRRVRVSGRSRYAEALLGADWPGSTGPAAGPADSGPDPRFRAMIAGCSGVRHQGSAALDLAYVAAGRFDGYSGMNLKPWDVAAGGLLVQEAGGLTSDFDGEQNWLNSGGILAGTPKIFTQMVARIKEKPV
jgi:myo-inositol-1(or 4)-monophosphatase